MIFLLLACWCTTPTSGPPDTSAPDSTSEDTSPLDSGDSGDPGDTGDTSPQDTGDTGDTGLEPLCSAEQTHVGDLSLRTSEEKAAFAGEVCCVEGVLHVFGAPEDSLECLRSASALNLHDLDVSAQAPVFQRGFIHVNTETDAVELSLPEWTEEARVSFYGEGPLTLHADRLEVLLALNGWGGSIPPEGTAHRLDAPMLTRIESLTASTRLDVSDYQGLSEPIGSLYVANEYGIPLLAIPADSLELRGLHDLDLSPLCGQPTRELRMRELRDLTGESCLLELPLEAFWLEDSKLPPLTGDAAWADGVVVELDNPSESFKRFTARGVRSIDLSIQDADALYSVKLPDVESGSISIQGHEALVVELPAMTQADTLHTVPGTASAPLLEQAGVVFQYGTLQDLSALAQADELTITQHEGQDLSALSGLTQVTGTLTINQCRELGDLSALHGLQSVGTLTISHTAATEAELQALVDAIGAENIGATDFRNNGP